MTALRDDCACGHDRTCHFDGAHNCLAMRCECKRFSVDAPPKARVLPAANYPRLIDARKNKPHHTIACSCSSCAEWEYRRRHHLDEPADAFDDGWPP